MTSTRFAGALLLALSIPSPAYAQRLSAQATAVVTVRVRPAIAIRSVARGSALVESSTHLTAASVVGVESNLPYRVTVRLASPHGTNGRGDAVRVLVRSADGSFERLVPGTAITAVVSRNGGQRAHEILCRVETAAPELLDADYCALTYELSAEHDDRLLRSIVTT